MIDFLEAIWGSDRPGLFGELRFIRDGKVHQAWFPLTRGGLEDAWAEVQTVNAAGWDAYYGVLPRIRFGGTADDVYQATTILWADIDSKQYGPDGAQAAKEAALAALRRPDLSPHIIVDSGGGYHAYWRLSKETSLPVASDIMKGIARQVGGDHVSDPPRVLRLPGSLNWKRGTPRPARILRLDLTTLYRPSDFSDYLQAPKQSKPPVEGGARFERQDLPDWLMELIKEGAPKGQRSERAFKAVIWLLRYGLRPDEIEDIFEAHPNGIGAKYHERGPKWLATTIAAAWKQT